MMDARQRRAMLMRGIICAVLRCDESFRLEMGDLDPDDP
jgi:hypothetical protein